MLINAIWFIAASVVLVDFTVQSARFLEAILMSDLNSLLIWGSKIVKTLNSSLSILNLVRISLCATRVIKVLLFIIDFIMTTIFDLGGGVNGLSALR